MWIEYLIRDLNINQDCVSNMIWLSFTNIDLINYKCFRKTSNQPKVQYYS